MSTYALKMQYIMYILDNAFSRKRLEMFLHDNDSVALREVVEMMIAFSDEN